MECYKIFFIQTKIRAGLYLFHCLRGMKWDLLPDKDFGLYAENEDVSFIFNLRKQWGTTHTILGFCLRTVAPSTIPALMITRFLMMYCPSSVGA